MLCFGVFPHTAERVKSNNFAFSITAVKLAIFCWNFTLANALVHIAVVGVLQTRYSSDFSKYSLLRYFVSFLVRLEALFVELTMSIGPKVSFSSFFFRNSKSIEYWHLGVKLADFFVVCRPFFVSSELRGFFVSNT